jgi:hypothetical protein
VRVPDWLGRTVGSPSHGRSSSRSVSILCLMYTHPIETKVIQSSRLPQVHICYSGQATQRTSWISRCDNVWGDIG